MEKRPDEANGIVARWYVIHTYSGYEQKVTDSILKAVENRGWQDRILEVKFPTEEVTEVRDGKTRKYQRKIFPGYVMVKMIMDDNTWYVVRNTRGVTGFVGQPSRLVQTGAKDDNYDHRRPIPLTDEEVTAMGVERIALNVKYDVGDNVTIVAGPLKGFTGTVKTIDHEAQKVKLIVSMFGKDTMAELDFVEVQQID
ncbi:MAG: transcription termination/antitermination factor NusG [Eubacteriales bacterium]|nr:transcription termination/antitermination factor NusG [Eubacteriales bacterium]MCI7570615.1 transcription termination/antitermination protein NusG [Clostridiales bacterium]MDD7550815.1 transcription termination/antitermination protein NusG [Clostridia bacterium]MDY5753822.1 transcription termination/antitermination protein NusG [Eubacteriales bacterium]